MKKRIFAILVAAGLLTLAACGGNGDVQDTPQNDPQENNIVAPYVPNDTQHTAGDADMQLLAQALDGFFADSVAPAASWAGSETHTAFVYIDGNGTQGVLASKFVDGLNTYYFPWGTLNDQPGLVRWLFYVYDGQVYHERFTYHHWVHVTSTGRLGSRMGADGQGLSVEGHTLFTMEGGHIVVEKTIGRTQYLRIEGYGIHPDHDRDATYVINHHPNGQWERDWNYDEYITHQEFNQLMERYGLNNIVSDEGGLQLPDVTAEIMAHLAD
ncbi:MAG: hypothetical protein FWC69_01305 [Defluviitaleaceae bacterium]|nr:hypothetical protein [Defluviitaleaceae bacterium]